MKEIPVLAAFRNFLFHKTRKIKQRFVILYGGAGSGKSYSVALKIVELCNANPNVQCLVTRKTFPALRITAYPMILDALHTMGVSYEHNRSGGVVALKNGSTILFKSMDDPEKIKSLNLDLVWIEEATDFNYEDFLQINLRLRGQNLEINQCFLTFNPIDEFHWLNTEMLQKRKKECAIHHSTYKDNLIFLPKVYTEELEALKEFDVNHYRIYAEGIFGRLENVIYRNWDEVSEMPNPRYSCYGIDFGFTNPTALVGVVMHDSTPTVKELLYESNLTNPELIQKLKGIIHNKVTPLYADPAEPKTIADIAAAGFNIQPADNSVWDGIKKITARPLHIHKSSPNLLKEIRAYTWRKDKNGNILEEPVKFRDHAMDAMRYAISTYWGGQQIPGSILDIRANLRTHAYDEALQANSRVSKDEICDW